MRDEETVRERLDQIRKSLEDATMIYYELALPDGSHDLRVWKTGPLG